MDKLYIVYLLFNTKNNYTYLGITNNSSRRLRQHNGDIKGGAKYTHSFKSDGEWKYYLQVTNLTKKEALSLERKVKNKRKYAKGDSPLNRRLNVLMPTLEEFPYCSIVYLGIGIV